MAFGAALLAASAGCGGSGVDARVASGPGAQAPASSSVPTSAPRAASSQSPASTKPWKIVGQVLLVSMIPVADGQDGGDTFYTVSFRTRGDFTGKRTEPGADEPLIGGTVEIPELRAKATDTSFAATDRKHFCWKFAPERAGSTTLPRLEAGERVTIRFRLNGAPRQTLRAKVAELGGQAPTRPKGCR